MSPVGMKGTKLISDILSDAGIPNHQRTDKLVVCDEEKILWCVGHCIGREALALPYTDKWKVTILSEII
jgi:tRNA(Ile)-lysidine synthase